MSDHHPLNPRSSHDTTTSATGRVASTSVAAVVATKATATATSTGDEGDRRSHHRRDRHRSHSSSSSSPPPSRHRPKKKSTQRRKRSSSISTTTSSTTSRNKRPHRSRRRHDNESEDHARKEEKSKRESLTAQRERYSSKKQHSLDGRRIKSQPLENEKRGRRHRRRRSNDCYNSSSESTSTGGHRHHRRKRSKHGLDELRDSIQEKDSRPEDYNYHSNSKKKKKEKKTKRSRHSKDEKRKRHGEKQKEDVQRRHKSEEIRSRKRHSKQRSSEGKSNSHRQHDDTNNQGNNNNRETVATSVMRFDMGPPLGHPPERLLDSERDYFAFHQHLWVYLFREEGIRFNDLQSSRESRLAFQRFVERYNQGALEGGYYEPTLPIEVWEECKTTKHQWSFQTTEHEQQTMQMLQNGVHRQTEYQSEPTRQLNRPQTYEHAEYCREANTMTDSSRFAAPSIRSGDGPSAGISNRRLREHVRTVEEELLGGRKDGRERQIEKKKEIAERIHGAARDRDGMVELTDETLYGDNEQASFQRALLGEKARALKKDEQKSARIAELLMKEKDKQQAMFKMLGVQPPQPK